MAQITPLENGLHSLAKALEAFERFHADGADVFAMKDTVLGAHHGLETIAKSALFEVNPIFLLRQEAKVGQFLSGYEEYIKGSNAFIIDEDFTIGLPEALDRLRSIGVVEGFSEAEFGQLRSAVDELQEFRNALQHFAIRANLEIVARVIGNAVPRFVDLMDVLGKAPSRFTGYGYGILNWGDRRVDLTGYRTKLNALYPNADAVLDLMRSRYDRLIGETKKFFTKRAIDGANLSLEVRDHGEVGAPPYYPRIKLTGFVNLELDPHGSLLRYEERGTYPVLSYEGSVHLAQPERIGREGPIPFEDSIRGSLSVKAVARLRTLEGILALPDGEQYVPLLRDAELQISAQIEYSASGSMRPPHFSVDRLTNVSGELSIRITALPSGYAEDDRKHLLVGQFDSPLSLSNAPFRLHAFMNPGGKLQTNRSLDWSIETSGQLHFE